MNLEKNALWVIMDPWMKTPYQSDLIKYPNLDQSNLIILKKIKNYIPNLNYVCVSCPLFVKDSDSNIIKRVYLYPDFNELVNFENNYNNFLKYMIKNNLSDVVYCGFHYGECILDKPDGAKYTSKKFNIFVKKDLCGVLPNNINYDNLVLKYAKII